MTGDTASGGGTAVSAPRPGHPRRAGALLPLGPVPVVGARAFLGIGRVDLLWVVALVLVAFALRAGSPLFPNWLSHPFQGAPIHAEGLSWPYNGGLTTTVTVDGPHSLFPRSGCGGETPADTAISRQEKLCGFVFDEVYFPVNAAYDAQQPAHDYFDPEPPLAKLLMAPPIVLLGFGGLANRLSVAIFGSLLCGLVYLIAMRLRRDRFFAACAGGFVALDGLALVESRTGVIDMIAVFLSTLCVYAFLLHWQARTRSQWTGTLYILAACLGIAFGAKLTAIAPLALAVVLTAGRFHTRGQWWRAFLVIGAALGIALSVKLNAGLVLGALITATSATAAVVIGRRLLQPAALLLVARLRSRRGPGFGEVEMWQDAAGGWRHYALAGLIMVTLFGACYSRYLTIDHNVPNFAGCAPDTGLTADPQNPSTLLRHPQLSQAGRSGADAALPQRLIWFAGDAVHTIYGHNRASLVYHSQECRDHPYGSRWYTWPVLAHPVLFYSDSSFTAADGGAETGWISNLGNPALWWLAIPALMFCAFTMSAGPVWWRVAVLALLAVSLALLVGLFHAGEQPPVSVSSGGGATTYLTAPRLGIAYTIAEGLMCVAGVLIVICAAVSRRFVPAFILLGALLTWLMWMPGNGFRVLFLYHMLNAVPFLALGLAYALTALRGAAVRLGGTTVSLRPVAYAAVGLVLASFVFFYPTWVGLPLPGPDHDMRIWFDSWSSGWS